MKTAGIYISLLDAIFTTEISPYSRQPIENFFTLRELKYSIVYGEICLNTSSWTLMDWLNYLWIFFKYLFMDREPSAKF